MPQKAKVKRHKKPKRNATKSKRMKIVGNELATKCSQLKLIASDGTRKLITIIVSGLSQIVKDERDLARGEDALRVNVAGGCKGSGEFVVETDPRGEPIEGSTLAYVGGVGIG